MALEREYNIPLRREYMKVPIQRRAKKTIKALREFLARHMKAEFENIKLSKWVNLTVWSRGIKNPPHHLKIKAIKDDKGIVNAELAVLPQKALDEMKKEEETKKKIGEEKEKREEKKEEKEEEKKQEEQEDEKEKEKKEREKILRKEMPKARPEQVEAKKSNIRRLALEK